MSKESNGTVLVASALRGGAAEVVLRAIGRGNSDKSKKESESRVGLSRIGFVWRDATESISLAGGLFRTENYEDYNALLVIGEVTGLFLNDATKPLSRNRHYSMAHDVTCTLESADYVVQISPSILNAGKEEVAKNVRRAANEISKFLLKSYPALKKLRASTEEIEKERLKRMKAHHEKHVAEESEKSPVELEHYVSMW